MMTLTDPGIGPILADGGFDWLFVDTEHKPFEDGDVVAVINIMRNRDCAVFVRIRENTMSNVKFVLDMGAQGVIVPQLKTADDFRRLVSYGKYPPLGSRRYSPLRVTDFWTDKADYDENADKEMLLIGQIECVEAADSIEEIVKIEGVDGFFIGPADLSWDMGCRGDASQPQVQEKITRVIDVCNAAGKQWGTVVASAEDYARRVAQGGKLLVFGSDSRYLKAAAKNAVDSVRNAVGSV